MLFFINFSSNKITNGDSITKSPIPNGFWINITTSMSLSNSNCNLIGIKKDKALNSLNRYCLKKLLNLFFPYFRV